MRSASSEWYSGNRPASFGALGEGRCDRVRRVPSEVATLGTMRQSLQPFPEHVREFREGARLTPDHLGMQFFGMLGLLAQVMPSSKAPSSGKVTLSADDARFAEETLARIEQIASRAQPNPPPRRLPHSPGG